MAIWAVVGAFVVAAPVELGAAPERSRSELEIVFGPAGLSLEGNGATVVP